MTIRSKPDVREHQSFFGMPEDVKFCKKCTYSNQKPNSTVEFRAKRGDLKTGIVFSSGICSACQYNEQKNSSIDWDQRRQKLQDLCDKYRSRNGSYDCLVPGSGGKDSFYAAIMLKEKFDMNPLTVTWAPNIYTDWGFYNFKAWIDSGLPNFLFHPNGLLHRYLSRLSLENNLHPFQPFILGQYGFPLKCVEYFNIPLVFYGENSAEYGNAIENNESPNKISEDMCLEDGETGYICGEEAEAFSEIGFSHADISMYLPPTREKFELTRFEWHYLGYYLKWHPQENYYFSLKHGFEPAPERNEGSYSRYASIDDKIDDFNFYTLFIKYGIGRTTFDTAQEIRRGEITRKEGTALVNRFDGEKPQRFAEDLFRYWSFDSSDKSQKLLSSSFPQPYVDQAYFDDLCDRFRSPHLWKFLKKDQTWKLRKNIDDR